MPELDKEIHHETDYLRISPHINQMQQETMIRESNFNDIQEHNLTLTVPYSERETESKNYFHRPFTAPPDPIPRSALRTNSEPPIPPTLYHPTNHYFIPTNDNEPDLNNLQINDHPDNDDSDNENDDNSKCDSIIRKCNNTPDLLKSSNTNLSDKQMSDINNETFLNSNKLIRNSEIETLNNKTWHAHVYANPPKTPTPHSIGDILGWTGGARILKSNIMTHQMTEIHDESSRTSLNQLLNNNLKADNFRNQTQFITRRCTSLSESSEDDSGICEQPLNLSITKSRDTSPALSIGKSGSRVKKGKWILMFCQMNKQVLRSKTFQKLFY